MRYAIPMLLLLLAGCPQERKPAPGGSATGLVIGSNFDGTPLTVGKGDLAGKPLVITWFATW